VAYSGLMTNDESADQPVDSRRIMIVTMSGNPKRVYDFIAQNPGSSMTTISYKLEIQRSQVIPILHRFESAGLTRREPGVKVFGRPGPIPDRFFIVDLPPEDD
jgi:DNA-binding MarR family transcriptional regulator